MGLSDILGGNSVLATQMYDHTKALTEGQQQADANVYTSGQTALQNQALQGLSGLLRGESQPVANALNKSAFDYAIQQWQKQGAPSLAAVHGAGSPTIDSAFQEMLLGVAAQQGNMASKNTLDAFNLAANWAFQPVGKNSTQTHFANESMRAKQTGVDWGGIAAGIFEMLKPPTPFP